MDFKNNNLGLSIDFWNVNGRKEEKSENDIYHTLISLK